jgi:hypothetical protein
MTMFGTEAFQYRPTKLLRCCGQLHERGRCEISRNGLGNRTRRAAFCAYLNGHSVGQGRLIAAEQAACLLGINSAAFWLARIQVNARRASVCFSVSPIWRSAAQL